MVVVRLTRDSLIHAYEQCYTAEEAVYEPDVFDDEVYVEETYTGAPIYKNRKVGTCHFKSGQVEGGSFLGKSPTEIVALSVAWCERVMAEIEQEARTRSVPLA